MTINPLNIFYEEPDPDRWFKYDHYPRKIIRRIVRGKTRPGGQGMVALNLLAGLKKIGIPYRFNDYKYIKHHPDEIACIIGKCHLLSERKWKNPILFGASVFSHPLEYPDLLLKHQSIKKILVPGEWMREMFDPYYGDRVVSWPVGIDTQQWNTNIKHENKTVDFLIYDKIRWQYSKYHDQLINPIKLLLTSMGLKYDSIRYGQYTHNDLIKKLGSAKAVIFLCEHETQGLAYQQILATNTPILAWDRQGYWQDPAFYPHKVCFEPVSAVPYWDYRCGETFKNIDEFKTVLDIFLQKNKQNLFSPRDFIVANLTLEKCAEAYVKIYKQVLTEL
jgi:hypothetical protein